MLIFSLFSFIFWFLRWHVYWVSILKTTQLIIGYLFFIYAICFCFFFILFILIAWRGWLISLFICWSVFFEALLHWVLFYFWLFSSFWRPLIKSWYETYLNLKSLIFFWFTFWGFHSSPLFKWSLKALWLILK